MNQDRLNKLLFVAITQHNIDDAIEVISEGADVNSSLYWHYENSKFGNTYGNISAIELAMYRYFTNKTEKFSICLTIIKFLIKNGAVLNRCCISGYSNFVSERTSLLKDLAWGLDSEPIYDFEKQKQYCDLFLLLIQHGADPMFLVEFGTLDAFDVTPLEIISYKLKEREDCSKTSHFCDKIIVALLFSGCPAAREDRIMINLNNTLWGERFKFWSLNKNLWLLLYCFTKKSLNHLCFMYEL
jgi:hypothetical protein